MGLNAGSADAMLGPAMKNPKSDLLQGTLDLLVLRTLEPGSLHGWGVSRRLQEISEDVLQLNQGSLYPALKRLEAGGWIRSEWGTSDNGRRARFYSLTRSGRRLLDREKRNWARLSAAVERVLQKA
jgi:transcriptional regulator